MPPPVGRGPAPTFRCTEGPLPGPLRVHLELFAHRRVVVIPPQVGIEDGCRYPLRTTMPTGVIELGRPGLKLGDFFAVWRTRLSENRLLGFRGPVTAYLGGKRWTDDPAAIPLFDRAQIVLEVGGYVPPHAFYLFPPR